MNRGKYSLQLHWEIPVQQDEEILDDDILNVVFIHGLQGKIKKTWGLNNIEEDIEEDIKKLLTPNIAGKKKYKVLHVYTYGYDTSYGNKDEINEISNNFNNQFEDKVKDKDTIIIAHSLGGIVIKNAINIKKKNLDYIKGILFYGTPHQHPFDYLKPTEVMSILVILYGLSIVLIPWAISTDGFLLNSLILVPILIALSPAFYYLSFLLFKPHLLTKITQDFIDISKKKIYIKCFHENRALGRITRIVSKKSATLVGYPSESCQGTHISMVKLDDPDAGIKQTLNIAINEILEYQPSNEEDNENLPLYSFNKKDTIIGRDTDINNIIKLFKNRHFVEITAAGGYGKTAVVKKIINDQRFLDKYHKHYTYSFYGQGIETGNSATGFTDFLYNLSENWDIGSERYKAEKIIKNIETFSSDSSIEKKYLLILDGTEVFYSQDNDLWDTHFFKLLELLKDEKNTRIDVLVATRKACFESEQFSLTRLDSTIVKEKIVDDYLIPEDAINEDFIEQRQLDVPLVLELFLNHLEEKYNKNELYADTLNDIPLSEENEDSTEGSNRSIEHGILGYYLNNNSFLKDNTVKNSYMLLSLFDRAVGNKLYKEVIKELNTNNNFVDVIKKLFIGNKFIQNLNEKEKDINTTGFSSLSRESFFDIHPILKKYYHDELKKKDYLFKNWHKTIAKVFNKEDAGQDDYFRAAYHYKESEEFEECAKILYDKLGKNSQVREKHQRMRYLHSLSKSIYINDLPKDIKLKFATMQSYFYMTNGDTEMGFNKTEENYINLLKEHYNDMSNPDWIDFLIHFAEIANYSGNAGNKIYKQAINDNDVRESLSTQELLSLWEFLYTARCYESKRYLGHTDQIKEKYIEYTELRKNFITSEKEDFRRIFKPDASLDTETVNMYHAFSHNIWQDRLISSLLDVEIDNKISTKKYNKKLVETLEKDTKNLLNIYMSKPQRKNYIPLAYENLAKIDYLRDKGYEDILENAIKSAEDTNKNDFILQTRITRAYLDYFTKKDNVCDYVQNKIINFDKFYNLKFKHMNFDIYILAILCEIKCIDKKVSDTPKALLKQLLEDSNYKFRENRMKNLKIYLDN